MTRPTIIPAIAADDHLYPIEKMDAHRHGGTLHLAVSVFVFSGDRLLVQRRAAGKYHCAGLWANTCCTHPHWGERLDGAAARRLGEELGFSLALRPAGVIEYRAAVGHGLVERERVHLFIGEAELDSLVVDPDPEEVDAVHWARLTDLQRERWLHPARLAPWFRVYLARLPFLAAD